MDGRSENKVIPGIMKVRDCESLDSDARVMMLSHAAAVTPDGATSVDWVRHCGAGVLVGVMGPEHGFLGHAAAGVACRSFRHPVWRLPVYSLYGCDRAPRASWLSKAEVLLVDLQDLGYRPYTYVSTLLLALQAAEKRGMPVVVADRPIPLPHVVDGPMLNAAFSSFVGSLPVPFCYGMTPGETALWIKKNLLPNLRLTVLSMDGFTRSQIGLRADLPWISPSPSIRSSQTAVVYPATVCLEGLPHIDHGRNTTMPFQLVGAPWLEPERVADELGQFALPGVRFHPHVYVPQKDGKALPGIRITVVDEHVFRPAEVMVHVLYVLTLLYGKRRVWQNRQARPDFFDKLMGTDKVRLGIMRGEEPASIIDTWQYPDFLTQRESVLLYR